MIARAARDRGFTLVEVLMGMLMGLIIIGGATMVFSAGMRAQPGLSKRDNAISQGRWAMERLTRELRQGSSVSSASANQLTFITYVNSPSTCGSGFSATANQCQVTYSCTTMGCTRALAKPDGTSPQTPVTVVTGLSNPNVFTYSPSSTAPSYIGATFVFSGRNGSDAITVSDGATLRNPAAPPS
jgi:prepilin-type N-terminal cleavage/methylation domain-containing protein